MFKGKDDVLAAYDAAPPGGGKGGSGGGGSGGGGDWRNFDWRDWGRQAWWRLRNSLKGFATAIGAALLFAGVLILGEAAGCWLQPQAQLGITHDLHGLPIPMFSRQ